MKRFIALALLCAGTALGQVSGTLTLRFFDVGQGDAVLIVAPEGQTLLYDGGRSESRMRELIRQYNLTRADVVVASHADADHITGLIPAVALLKPSYFINNGLAGDTQVWERLINVVSLAKVQTVKAANQVINLGSVRITVLAPPAGMPPEQNLNSVGLLLQYGNFRALMTGDSELRETFGWLKLPMQLGPVDVYKSIHHGASNGDSGLWLKAVQPKNVIISVGPNNYGHPTRSALNLYQSMGAQVYRTDQQGTVTVTVQVDGSYSIAAERNAINVPPATLPPAVPAPTPYYRTCAEARAAGASPLYRGQPGYRPELDRDGDGKACE